MQDVILNFHIKINMFIRVTEKVYKLFQSHQLHKD